MSHAPASGVSRGGLAALVVSTLIAVVVVSVGQSNGSGEIAAELPSAESTSQTATSLEDVELNDTESSASSLLDDVDGAALFEAGARDDMPDTTEGEALAADATADAARAEASPADAATAADEIAAPRTELPAPPSTVAAASATAGAQIAPPTTAAPTTQAPTTAAPTTAAPTTAAPTTAAPTTAAPTTAAPTTAAPTTEPAPPPTPSTSVPVDSGTPTLEQWAALRNCESGGRYSVISPNGLYHGAYQFAQSTWNGVARSAGREDLVGVAPSAADPADQDAMALVLWTQRGSQPWPVCGRHLP